jgi:hypothetical protein
VTPATSRTDYGGPLLYASLNGHEHRSLAAHDDLCALTYMLVDLAKGSLPWTGCFNPTIIHHIKLTVPDDYLFAALPLGACRFSRAHTRGAGWLLMHQYVKYTCTYGVLPDYGLCELYLRNAVEPVAASTN